MVAVIDYLPGPWPTGAGIVCLARRTRIPADRIPTDPRARKRRTIDKEQLALALDGKIDHVHGYSFVLTNLDCSTPEKVVEVEHWYRHRTDIESLNKDAKHGAGLRHMPSGDRTVNTPCGCGRRCWSARSRTGCRNCLVSTTATAEPGAVSCGCGVN